MNTAFFLGLIPELESADFKELIVADSKKIQTGIRVTRTHGKGSASIFRVLQNADQQPKHIDSHQVLSTLRTFFEEGYDQVICRTKGRVTTYSKTPKGVRVSKETLQQIALRDNEISFEAESLSSYPPVRDILVSVGILSPKGSIRRRQYNKLIQIKNLLKVVYDILPEFRGQTALDVVDAACGKSYLSFVLKYFLSEEWGFVTRFQCIDTNSRLVSTCEGISADLAFDDMKFITASINEFEAEGSVDILYSLHGCDTATDEAIAAGIRMSSKVIVVVPCCHFELRSQLQKHPLQAITKHGLFEERFATLLTDSLRCLALEAAGYNVSTFRFVTDDISPKNTLIRAVKHGSPNPQALQQYHELAKTFRVSPKIEKLLPKLLSA